MFMGTLTYGEGFVERDTQDDVYNLNAKFITLKSNKSKTKRNFFLSIEIFTINLIDCIP